MAKMDAAWNLQNNPELQKAAQNYQKHLNWANQQKVNKRSNIQKYAPAAGATAGGILAAVLTRGMSIGPTLAALGAAGAVGGGAGETYAQKSNKERINVGKIRNEALISGATAAIPVGGFGRTARIAGQAGSSAATAGAEQVVGKGLAGKIANSGRRLETRAGGYGIGNSKPGTPPIDIFNQRKIQTTLRAEKIKPGHPEDLAINAQVKLKGYHQQMDAALTKNNVTFKPTEINQLRKGYLSKINSSATVDPNIRKYAAEFSNNLKNVKDLKGLNSFRKELDKKAISWIANPDATTAAKTEAARTLRTQLSEVIGTKAPALKAVNTKYSDLANASDYLTKEAGVLTKQSQNAGAGLTGRLMTGDMASTAKAKVGAAMQKVTGIGPNATAGSGLVRPTVGEFGKQSLAQSILGATQNNAQDPYAPQAAPEVNPATNTPNGPYDPNYVAPDPSADPNADPNAPLDPTAQDTQQPQESPYSLQQALADIQRDPKHTSDYLATYKAVAAAQKDAAKAAGGAGHGIISAQSYSNAQSGAQSLQMLGQLIQGNPSLTSKTSIPGQGVPVVGGYVQKALGTNQYKALAHNVADAVLRLRTGAQANESEIRLYMTQFLPQAGDPPQTVQQKLQILQSNFTPYLGSGGPTDLTSLTDALSAAQGGL